MSGNFEQAREFFRQGVADYEAGHFGQAEQNFLASLALLPGRPSSLTNLGATRLKLGKLEEALAVLDQAVAQEPDNAEAQGHRAAALAELGRKAEALAAFDRAVALEPRKGEAWSLRGSLLRDMGRFTEAAASFKKALEHGADGELNRYYLASVAGDGAPSCAPRHYVEALFDSYAGQFDRQLTELKYEVPRRLLAPLGRTKRAFARALDMGCGTGLCGPLLRPLAAQLHGVDVSRSMLDRAQALGVYDLLQRVELTEFLASAHQAYDLVVAADVFIYVGALEATFSAVARVMPTDGVFCFSVEAAQEHLELRPTLRYAHSEPYVRALADGHGFTVTSVEHGSVREDQRQPIAGLYFWLARR